MGRSSRQKNNKETLDLKDTLEIDGLNIHRTFHPKAAKYTSFPSEYKCNILQDRPRVVLQKTQNMERQII